MNEPTPRESASQRGLARAVRELLIVVACAVASAALGGAAAVAGAYFATPYVLDYFQVERTGGGLHGGGQVAALILLTAWGAAGLLGAALCGGAGFWLGMKWRMWRARRAVVDKVRGVVFDQAIDIVRDRLR